MTRKGHRTILAIFCMWAACGVWGAAPPDAGAFLVKAAVGLIRI